MICKLMDKSASFLIRGNKRYLVILIELFGIIEPSLAYSGAYDSQNTPLYCVMDKYHHDTYKYNYRLYPAIVCTVREEGLSIEGYDINHGNCAVNNPEEVLDRKLKYGEEVVIELVGCSNALEWWLKINDRAYQWKSPIVR